MTREELTEAVHTILREGAPDYMKMVEDQEKFRERCVREKKLFLASVPSILDRMDVAIKCIFMQEMEPDFPRECTLIRQALNKLQRTGALPC